MLLALRYVVSRDDALPILSFFSALWLFWGHSLKLEGFTSSSLNGDSALNTACACALIFKWNVISAPI